MSDAKEYTKAKAEEYKVSEKASYAGGKIKGAATSAATYTKESATSIKEHYNNGTLGEVTK